MTFAFDLAVDFERGVGAGLAAVVYGGLGMFAGLLRCIWKDIASRSCFSVG